MLPIYRFICLILFGVSNVFAQDLQVAAESSTDTAMVQQEQPADSIPQGKVLWDDGLRFEFEEIGLNMQFNAQLQMRLLTSNDSERVAAEDENDFDIRRARLNMQGDFLQEEFSYRFSLEFAEEDNSDIRDLYIGWHACDSTELRVGQMKTSISRQFLGSSTTLQFPERSVASNHFDRRRQAGVRLMQGLMEDRIIFWGSYYDGQQRGVDQERAALNDANHAYDFALRVDLLGQMNPLEEGDQKGTRELALNAGAAYFSENSAYEALSGLEFDNQLLSTDLNLKYRGLSLHTEYFSESQSDFSEQSGDADGHGLLIQSGYFFFREKLELALRYSLLDCDNGRVRGEGCSQQSGPVDNLREMAAVLNYFIWDNHLKAQFSYSHLKSDPVLDAADRSDAFWLFQLNALL